MWTSISKSPSIEDQSAVCLTAVGLGRFLPGRVQMGDMVAAVGCGGVGLNLVQCAAGAGGKVLAIDMNEERLAIARSLGAAETINPDGIERLDKHVRKLMYYELEMVGSLGCGGGEYLSGAGYRIYGDGIGTYVDGECGIDAVILSSSQDAWMDPDVEWNARLGCPRRSVVFDYSCEVGQTCTPGTDVEASGARMTIGALGIVTSEAKDAWVFFVPDFCKSGILFDPAEDADTDYARARLVSEPGASPRRWEVWTSPGSDVAVCRGGGKGRNKTPAVYYRLPFFLVITEE